MPPMAPDGRGESRDRREDDREEGGAAAKSPSAFVVMKERMAVRAARTPHAACHSSGWCCEMLRRIRLRLEIFNELPARC
jgi:hypothetical protein